MIDQLEFSSYSFEGHDELCLKAGKNHEKQILLVPPLFDEMNRMRRMIVDNMRELENLGVGSILPDLPGANESLFAQEDASFDLWRRAIAQCASQHNCTSHIATFRGSALIDNCCEGAKVWRLSPVKGSTILRTMMRTKIVSDKEAGISITIADLAADAENNAINLAGNDIGPAMFNDLQEAKLPENDSCRTVRLESESQPADNKVSGSALWLRAEPDEDNILSQAIAADIANWIGT